MGSLDRILMVVQVAAQHREGLRVSTVRQNVQTLVDAVDALADPLGHAALPVPVLRQAFPPKVRHEETHLHPHRSVGQLSAAVSVHRKGQKQNQESEMFTNQIEANRFVRFHLEMATEIGSSVALIGNFLWRRCNPLLPELECFVCSMGQPLREVPGCRLVRCCFPSFFFLFFWFCGRRDAGPRNSIVRHLTDAGRAAFVYGMESQQRRAKKRRGPTPPPPAQQQQQKKGHPSAATESDTRGNLTHPKVKPPP